KGGSTKALLMKMRHVETFRPDDSADRRHERLGATAEDFSSHEIRREKRELVTVDTAHQAAPRQYCRTHFGQETDRQIGHPTRKHLKLVAKDNVLRPTGRIHEGDVSPRVAVE